MIVIDMDMPHNCSDCILCQEWEDNTYVCGATYIPTGGGRVRCEDDMVRPKWCPIKTKLSDEEKMCLLMEIALSPEERTNVYKLAQEIKNNEKTE